MAKIRAKWASEHGQISKIKPSDANGKRHYSNGSKIWV